MEERNIEQGKEGLYTDASFKKYFRLKSDKK